MIRRAKLDKTSRYGRLIRYVILLLWFDIYFEIQFELQCYLLIFDVSLIYALFELHPPYDVIFEFGDVIVEFHEDWRNSKRNVNKIGC